MLVFDVILIVCLFKMRQELRQCIQEKDQMGLVILSLVFVMTLVGMVLLNVSYYGH